MHAPALAHYASYDDLDGYSVLTGLLVKEGEGWRNESIQISALTTQEIPSSGTSFEKCIKVPDEFVEAASNFTELAKASYLLQDKFGAGAQLRIVNQPRTNTSKSSNPPKSKKSIDQIISGGTYFVSPVGFDKSKTHAIVRVNYICGDTCGGGQYYLLEKTADGWKEVKAKAFCFWQY